MRKSKRSDNGDVVLLKHTVAEQLREEIVKGALKPGEKIVERRWAKSFGVSQASIREAISLLATDGFVTKALGRSARVINLSAEDVRQIYEMRGALEGLAARLAAEKGTDTFDVEKAFGTMERSAQKDDVAALLDANLAFHLGLCRLSDNSYLTDYTFRLLTPFFAFVRIRAIASGQSASVWAKDFPAFRRIVELIKEGEGDTVEQYIKRVMVRIAASAYDSWEKNLAAEHGSFEQGSLRSGSSRCLSLPIPFP
ncbi:MAG TPA: GntR family transcriptional regulator [Acidobacteriaceae bacterium]